MMKFFSKFIILVCLCSCQTKQIEVFYFDGNVDFDRTMDQKRFELIAHNNPYTDTFSITNTEYDMLCNMLANETYTPETKAMSLVWIKDGSKEKCIPVTCTTYTSYLQMKQAYIFKKNIGYYDHFSSDDLADLFPEVKIFGVPQKRFFYDKPISNSNLYIKPPKEPGKKILFVVE